MLDTTKCHGLTNTYHVTLDNIHTYHDVLLNSVSKVEIHCGENSPHEINQPQAGPLVEDDVNGTHVELEDWSGYYRGHKTPDVRRV